MKNRLILGVGFAFLMAIFSCKSTKPTAETSTNKETKSQANPDSSANTAAKPLSADREEVAKKEKWVGNEIVEKAVSRLKGKLSTSNATDVKLKAILTDTFKSIGGDLNASYTLDESRAMGKKIIVNSKDPIIAVLENDSQRTAFKNLFLE